MMTKTITELNAKISDSNHELKEIQQQLNYKEKEFKKIE